MQVAAKPSALVVGGLCAARRFGGPGELNRQIISESLLMFGAWVDIFVLSWVVGGMIFLKTCT